MKSIKLRSHVGSDGILHLKVPIGLTNAGIEVTVTVQPIPAIASPEELGWSPGFFERTAGAWEGKPISRESQGEYEIREKLF